MKYEEYRPLIVNEKRSLNAVGEPRLIRPVSILIAVMTNTAFTGVSVRGCTYAFVSPALNDRITAFESRCTRISNRELHGREKTTTACVTQTQEDRWWSTQRVGL